MPTLRNRTDDDPLQAVCRLLLAAGGLLLLAGCPASQPQSKIPADVSPLAGVKLKLLVVGDARIAASAVRLQGEWAALTQSEFQVDQVAEDELAGAALPAADAIVCPAYLLGELAERMPLVRLPDDIRQGDSRWSGFLELPRLQEARWGTEIRAIPFGSPVLICYYRADLLKKLKRRPPQTWAEYRELAELLDELADQEEFSDRERGDGQWCGTIEPLAPGWAGLTLLARAAPYARHRDNYSTLFDIRTMEPLVAGPPFVRALEELVAAAEFGPDGPRRYDPAEARASFWKGRCGMTLSWPAAVEIDAAAEREVGLCNLPGSPEVYDVGDQAWESRSGDEDSRVPLMSSAGRIGVVSAKSSNAEAAFELLLWLAGEKHSPQVSAQSAATTLFRKSHLLAPQAWVEEPMPSAAAAAYAALAEETFSRRQCLFALRIPGRRQYLAALDEAVLRAVSDGQPPADALRQAAARWRKINQQRGIEKQKQAYLRSLGLLESKP